MERATLAGVLGVAVLAALAVYSSGSKDAAAPPLRAGWQRIDSPEAGLSIAVPKGWTQIDLEPGQIAESLRKTKISGVAAATIERSAAALAGKDALYLVDTMGTSSGYVGNISGLCAPNNGVPVDQMKNAAHSGLARMGAKEIQSSRLTIGGMPAVKASYTAKAAIAARAVQFRILTPDDKICGVTFGMSPGKEIKDLDDIADTIRPLPERAG
ncbi:hypothetical protein [Actinomadura sp. 9N407]|uniref:hypothetical protein n=1 Tax=Actinomadura sp. 9N407 TaxID=3375154 RepID=UPI0037A36331